jgi:hypothetical protein
VAGDFRVDVAASTLSHHAKTLREAGISRQESTIPAGEHALLHVAAPRIRQRFPGLLPAILGQPADAPAPATSARG